LVYIKKISLFILAFLIAVFLSEFFVSTIIHYPKYGVEKKYYRSVKYNQKAKLYLPYSEYWTVEGGNKVYKRNNIGLPGTDVDIKTDSKYIFILGASYTESLSVPPEAMATSRFQNLLRKDSANYNVLNLGYAGYTVYDDYFRSVYFERLYKPEKVFLVIHVIYEIFQITDNVFDIEDGFGKADSSTKTLFTQLYGNNSSFLYLLTSAGNKTNAFEDIREKKIDTSEKVNNEIRRNSLVKIEMCLRKFKERYGDNFIFVPIIDEKDNADLRVISESVGVNFISKNMLTNPAWRLNETGHLNSEGSKILSELLYEAYHKFNKK
jgi:hypothetical protein